MPMHRTSSHSCGAPIPPASARSAVPPSQRRLETVVVDDPRIGAARAALDEERYGRSPEARDLKRLVAELDELAWAQQARGAEREYVRCFGRAWAAN